MRTILSQSIVALSAPFGRDRLPFLAVAVVLAGAVVCGAPMAHSATYTWNSAATGVNWSAASNWGGAVPGSGDIGLFSAGSYTAQPSLSATSAIGGIWDTGSGSLTIGGSSALTLFGTTINGNTAAGIEIDAGAGPLTINCPLVLQNSQQWINNGTKPLDIEGNVSGSSLTCTGSGAQILDGTDTFSGALSVSAGTLQLSSFIGALSTANENIGTSGSAFVVQIKGVNSVTATASLNGLLLGYASSSQGYYTLSGGSVTSNNEYIGYSGTGTFTQSSGTNTSGNSYLGYSSGALGSYSLSGNGLFSVRSTAAEFVGYSGSGSFTQSGGTNSSAGSGSLYLGFNLNGYGTYSLSGNGLLTAGSEVIGLMGNGSFNQSGGTNSSNSLLVAEVSQSATYSLNNGLLAVTNQEHIGYMASGSFTQTGGMNLAGVLILATSPEGVGNYHLNGGTASASNELIGLSGSGSFMQSSGMNLAGGLVLTQFASGYGAYNLNGGLLLIGSGGITQGSGTAAFNFGGGTLGATTPWPSSVNMTLTGSGGYSTVDTTGGSIALSGNLTGSGTLSKVGPGILSLNGASSNIGGLIVDGGTLQIPGGSLGTSVAYLGYSATGAVAQTGGSHMVSNSLYFGYNSGSYGAYNLSGGSLHFGLNEFIGYSGSGSFTQSGGTNTVAIGNMDLGYNSGAFGTYTLSGTGLLNPFGEFIGYSGSGTFTQTGGTNSASYVDITNNAGSNGAYNLGGGLLSATQVFVGSNSAASASFSQTGGTLTTSVETAIAFVGTGSFVQIGGINLTPQMLVGYSAGSIGSYSLGGSGRIAAPNEFIGYGGTGSFTQSGGANAISADFYMGMAASGSGSYLLTSGMFSAPAAAIGYEASGSFTQSGGTDSVGGLSLAYGTASYGAYNLNGGLLLIGNTGITQGSGAVSFNFGGGTLGATAPWSSSVNMTVTGSGGISTVDTTGGNISLTGNILGNGGLAKVGPGTLTLTGSNTYSGSTTVDGGTLQMPSGALASPTQYVGFSSTGSFAQSGGTNALSFALVLGNNNGSSGTYSLSGSGVLSAGFETIGFAGSGSFTQSGGTNSLANYMYLGNNSGQSGTYNLNGSGLLSAAVEYIGVSGSGTFTQSGGTNSLSDAVSLGYAAGSSGTYSLSGAGLLLGSDETIGDSGHGNFMQSGGTNSLSYLYLGNNAAGGGTYSLSGSGLLSAGDEYVGVSGGGSFTQSSGSNSLSILYVGYNSSGLSSAYNLGGSGLLSATDELVGVSGSGSFIQSGGTNMLNALYVGHEVGGSGTYTLSGNGLLSASEQYIGVSGSGGFSQSGGTNSSSAGLFLGYNAGGKGTYSLSGGLLIAPNETIGNSGSGSFNQTGGTNATDPFYLAFNAGSYATYNLSGTGLLTSDAEYIGYAGSGSFTQSGGTNSTGSVVLAQSAGSFGVYTLTGGLLLIGSGAITQGSGTASFNFGGGTLGAITALSSSISMTLTGAPSGSGGSATIDTTGGNIGLSGVLSGSGGLNKAGTGTLTLAGPNTFSGATSILGGTLLLANSNAVQNSTVNVLVGNGLEFLPGIGTFNLGGLSGAPPLTLSNTAGSAITLSAGGDGASTTYSGNISGNGALVKVGTGMLTLSGSNGFGGGTTISGGALGFTGTRAVPGAGVITIGPSGALVATPVYSTSAPVSSWLAAGRIAANPAGAIALPDGTVDNESIALSATSSGLSLGAIGSATYSGTLTTAASTVYLGGGGGNLYFTSNLSGSGSLAVGTRGVPDGSVVLTGVNALGGTLVVDGGTLQLPGGSLTMTSTASGYEYVGYSGTATFTQTGGTNTVGTALVLGQNPGSVGNYNLLGGLLVVPSIVQGSGSGSLNIAGGSLTAATGALTVASPIVLSAAGSNGTFDTSGSSITLAGQISGAGGLTKVGSSTLVLAAANTYTGGTTVAQGTLLLSNSNAAQNTSINVAVDNGLQFAGVGTFNIGALGGAGDLVLADTAGHAITAITGGNSATTTYSGAISGGGTLVHGGPGVLVLNGVNSYTGGTILTPSAGPGGVVVYSQSSFVGPYTFAGNNSLGFGTSMSATNAITFDNGVTGSIDTMGNMVVLNGLMSGGGTLNKIDSGTLMLSDSNSLSGAAAISQGALQLANANAAANSTVAVNTDNGLQFSTGIGVFNVGGLSGGGVLTLADTGGVPINLLVGGNNQNTTFSGLIAGAGTLTKAGNGSLDLTGTNTWEGGLLLEPGVVAFNRDAALGAPTNRITFAGGDTLRAQASITLSPSRGITINSGARGTFDPGGNILTVDGVIGGAGTLAVAGSGTLVLANTNTYSGGTVVSSGALEAASTSALPGAFTAGKVSLGSGALLVVAVGGPQQWTAAEANQLLAVPGLFGSGAGFGIDASGGSFNPSSIDYLGRVLTLAGSNSYSGDIAVSQGTLELANSSALINSTVEIDGANVLQFSPGLGTFFLGGLSGAKHLDLDDTSSGGVKLIVGGNGQSTTFSGQITGDGSLTLAGSGKLVLAGTNDYSGSTYVAEGTLIAMTNYALADGSSISVGNTSLFAATVPASAVATVTGLNGGSVAVPEPSALALLVAGSLLAAAAAFTLKKPRAATV